MLYRELRDAEVLMSCEPGLVYMLAINGMAQEYDPKQQRIIFDGLSDGWFLCNIQQEISCDFHRYKIDRPTVYVYVHACNCTLSV